MGGPPRHQKPVHKSSPHVNAIYTGIDIDIDIDIGIDIDSARRDESPTPPTTNPHQPHPCKKYMLYN